MTGCARAFDFILAERRIVHQQIGGPGDLNCRFTGACVARIHETTPRPRLSDYIFRTDRSSIDFDRFAAMQSPKQWTFGDAQLACALDIETAEPFILD